MLKLNSKLTELIELAERKGACEEGIAFGKELVNNNSDITIEEYLTYDISDSEILWTLTLLSVQLSEDLRKEYYKKINDIMLAFQLYIELSKLSEEEDKILESKFKGKLPLAEKELKEGKVNRRKKS